MGEETEVDHKAEEWFNLTLNKLQYKQDYEICAGHSMKIMNEDGTQKGLKLTRPYVQLYGTGVTKLYRHAVLGDELPDVVYTPEEEKAIDEALDRKEEIHQRNFENEQ